MHALFPWDELWVEVIFAAFVWGGVILLELLIPSTIQWLMKARSPAKASCTCKKKLRQARKRSSKLEARLEEVEARVGLLNEEE